MNKTIAEWLLQALGKVAVESYESSALAVSVVQSILRSILELDFSLDILKTVNAPDPIGVLRPLVVYWVDSPSPSQANKAMLFAHRQGLIQSHTSSSNSNNNVGIYSTHSMPTSPGSQRSSGSSSDWLDATTAPAVRSDPIRMNLRTLLLNNPKGLLPSSIPGLYRQLFKQNLDMSLQDLEEELIGLGADIAGEFWPGERVFCLRPTPSNCQGTIA